MLACWRRRCAIALIAFGALSCGDSTGPGFTLAVVPNPVLLILGDSVQLSVSALDPSGQLVTGIAVTFAAADTSLVTVSNLGVIRTRGRTGMSSIRVSGGGAFTNVAVTVVTAPAGILVAPTDTAIRTTAIAQYRAAVIDEAGDTITGLPITWQSTDTTIATITADGVAIAGSKAGETFIIARHGVFGAGGRLRVVIPGEATSITVTPADTAIPAGDSVQLTATARDGFGDPVPGATVTWESGNTVIATVSTSGMVQSEGPLGDVLIHARSGAVDGAALVTVLDSMLTARVKLAGRPYAAAISTAGVAYVGQTDLARLARADLPSQAFEAGVTVGRIPTEVAFNSTGTRAYVTNQLDQNVGVVNVATNTQIDVIPVTGDPFEVIVVPGDSILYVSTNTNTVYGIRLSTKAVIATFSTPAIGNGMVIRDTLLYVSTHSGGTVVEFNLRTRTVARTFAVGGVPQKVALSADGNTLYIANEAGYVQFWDLVGGDQVGTNLALPNSAGYGMARRASNGLLYVTSAYFGGGKIYIIDPTTRTLARTIAAGGSPRRVVFNASGSIGFVPNEGGWVDFLK